MAKAQPQFPESLHENALWMRRLARALTGDPVKANDIVQQAFTVALERPPRTTDSLRGWLRTVVKHLAFRSHRDDARREQRERRVARSEAVVTSPAKLAEQLELHRRITDMVLGLGEPYRSTIILRYHEDLTPRAIAERSGVAEATVRSRLQRALEKLRGELDRSHAGRRESWMSALIPLAFPEGLRAAGVATPTAPVAAGSGSTFMTAVSTGGFLMTQKTLVAYTVTAVLLFGGGFALWQWSPLGSDTAPHDLNVRLDQARADLAAAHRGRDALDRENRRLKSTIAALREKAASASAAMGTTGREAAAVETQQTPAVASGSDVDLRNLSHLIATALPALGLRHEPSVLTGEQKAELEQLVGELIKVEAAARVRHPELFLDPTFFRELVPALLADSLRLDEDQRSSLETLTENIAESLPGDVATLTPLEKDALRREIFSDLGQELDGAIRDEQRESWDVLQEYLESILCAQAVTTSSLGFTNQELIGQLTMAYRGLWRRAPAEALRPIADDYLTRARAVVEEYGTNDASLKALTDVQKDQLDSRLIRLQTEFEQRILPHLDDATRAEFLRRKPVVFRFCYERRVSQGAGGRSFF